jgi:hypothetical protein
MDDPGFTLTLSVRHDDKPLCHRHAQTEEPGFTFGVIWIGNSELERIPKHGSGFWKTDAMSLEVLQCFRWIPLKLHAASLSGQ